MDQFEEFWFKSELDLFLINQFEQYFVAEMLLQNWQSKLVSVPT